MSTHNLCFGSKIKKIDIPLFYYIKAVYERVHFSWTCFSDACGFKYMYNMSCVMRKPDFCLCVNKDADQLRSNCEADQCLCFRYTDTQSLCQTWWETGKTGFHTSRLI